MRLSIVAFTLTAVVSFALAGCATEADSTESESEPTEIAEHSAEHAQEVVNPRANEKLECLRTTTNDGPPRPTFHGSGSTWVGLTAAADALDQDLEVKLVRVAPPVP